MKLLLATSNQGKAQELQEFFGKQNFNFLSLQNFPKIKEPEENGKTFKENSEKKAKYFGQKFKNSTIGEDSGIILDAFPKKFGLRTRREIQAENDEEWLNLFLKLMHKQTNRKATFYSAITFFDPIKKTKFSALGKTTGTILENPAGPIEQGIPISSIFIPEGHNKVFSKLSKTKKNEISHRGKSAKIIKKQILNYR